MPPLPVLNRPQIHTSVTEISHAIDRTIKEELFPVAYTTEEEQYFKTNPKPAYIDELIKDAKEFIDLQYSLKRNKIVLITSGGTTVPLENNTAVSYTHLDVYKRQLLRYSVLNKSTKVL